MLNSRGVSMKEGIVVTSLILGGGGLLWLANQPRVERKNSTTCFDNLKRIGMALQQYTEDNSGYYPLAWSGRDPGPSDAKINAKWMDMIYPYLKDPKYFQCPSDSTSNSYQFRQGTNYGSYIMNNAYSRDDDTYTPPAGYPASGVQMPNTTILVAHGSGNFQIEWPEVDATPGFTTEEPLRFGEIVQRHGRNTSRLFCDGSARGYNSLEYDISLKVINGWRIATGLTIQQD
jgi:hypothetical protein